MNPNSFFLIIYQFSPVHRIALQIYKYFLNTRLYFSMIFVKEYFTQFKNKNQFF